MKEVGAFSIVLGVLILLTRGELPRVAGLLSFAAGVSGVVLGVVLLWQ